jgi:hypothetical protein
MPCSYSIFTFVLLLLAVTLAVAEEQEDEKLANALVDWIRNEGGYFSPSLKIGRLHDDPLNPLGLFASQDIEPHESLLIVPHSTFISLWDEAAEDDDDDDSDEAYVQNVCRLAQKLDVELKIGNDSDYKPFVEYIQNQKQGQIPATWSEEGKQALGQVLPEDSDVIDWTKRYFADCNVDEAVLALTVQRGYDTALIPVWDLVNHRNGNALNTENDPMYSNDALQVRASKNIRKGEEIFATYNECVDCRETSWYWGTPEILRDFGFVEGFPQRWIYLNQDPEILFEIDQNDDGELEVEWDIEEDGYGVPDDEGIAFLQSELKRLQELHLDERGSVPQHEWNTIIQYHKACITAISEAVKSAVEYHQEEEDTDEL